MVREGISNHMRDVCMCVDVCHPNEGVTCGLYGQDVSVYFVITSTLQKNLWDMSFIFIQGVNGVSLDFAFGYPASPSQSGSVALIRPERTSGIVVNNASVHDSGQYMCTIKNFANTWSMTLNQTLQLCGR
jgi:hypothetical protein